MGQVAAHDASMKGRIDDAAVQSHRRPVPSAVPHPLGGDEHSTWAVVRQRSLALQSKGRLGLVATPGRTIEKTSSLGRA